MLTCFSNLAGWIQRGGGGVEGVWRGGAFLFSPRRQQYHKLASEMFLFFFLLFHQSRR